MSAVVSRWLLGALLVGHNVTGFRADFNAEVTQNRFSCLSLRKWEKWSTVPGPLFFLSYRCSPPDCCSPGEVSCFELTCICESTYS